ncbi:MAG: hypothetical protein J0I90_00515, partial [Nitrosospira sp.]|nr:hypothetical protein [Nitrosospira sp.]
MPAPKRIARNPGIAMPPGNASRNRPAHAREPDKLRQQASITSLHAKTRYFAGGRWLPGDHVVSLAKATGNNTSYAAGQTTGHNTSRAVLVLTDQGLAKIDFTPMTLHQKAMYYEDIVRRRHIRYGFYCDYTNM